MITVRRLKMGFADARPHWCRNPEFAQNQNASSLMPVHVEPYLIKVMHKVKEQLGPEHAELRADVDLFIHQETQHYKLHQRFNKSLYAAGYDQLPVFEQELAGDYRRYLAERSLQFNCAYSEGFETLGPPNARAYFEYYADLLEGADQEALDLWKWHMLEEFEHRHVAFSVYKTLFSRRRPVRAYFYRLYGFFCAASHLGKWGKRVTNYLVAKDRERMTTPELAESRARERAYQRVMRRHYLPQLLRVLSPFYDPQRAWPEPRGMQPFLQYINDRYTSGA